jgi:hypothetical protein
MPRRNSDKLAVMGVLPLLTVFNAADLDMALIVFNHYIR